MISPQAQALKEILKRHQITDICRPSGWPRVRTVTHKVDGGREYGDAWAVVNVTAEQRAELENEEGLQILGDGLRWISLHY